MNKKTVFTIIGGSNSAHSIIPLLSNAGKEIQLYTRKPDKWNSNIVMEYQDSKGNVKNVLEGKISKISSNYKDLIPQSNVIILSLPVHSYRKVLHEIAPYINKKCDKVIISTIYGQGGFNWMVDEIKQKFDLNNIVSVAVGLIPWITRTKNYGSVGVNYGPKEVNVAAVYPREEFDYVNDLFLDDICYNWFKTGKFVQAQNFLSLTLSVDNQIIHQTRLYGLYKASGGSWDEQDKVPLFYAHYDDLSSDYLKKLDDEYSKIREKIFELYPNKSFEYMLDYLALERLSYGSANDDIRESFVNSETLALIPTPVVQNEKGKFVINTNHRFFYDDIYYGIMIAKWIADKLSVNTPFIDELLTWAQEMIGDSIIKDGCLVLKNDKDFRHGLPEVYGFKTIEDLID